MSYFHLGADTPKLRKKYLTDSKELLSAIWGQRTPRISGLNNIKLFLERECGVKISRGKVRNVLIKNEVKTDNGFYRLTKEQLNTIFNFNKPEHTDEKE